MNFKRIFKGPLPYILIAIIVFWVGSSLLNVNGMREVTTDHGLVNAGGAADDLFGELEAHGAKCDGHVSLRTSPVGGR